jgi:nucleoside-diphosphate-sugar epimerase
VVTGVTGFVGRHLARELHGDAWTVHGVTRGGSRRRPHLPPEVMVHELTDSVSEIGEVIGSTRPDAVFHVAAFTGSDQSRLAEMVEANVTFSAAVARAATAAGARLVHVSSAWQHYGGAAYSPVSLYGATKQAQCDVVQYYAEAEGLDAREVCLFDTYGRDDDRGKLVTLLMDAAQSGASLSLSSGRQLVDLTYVSDVAAALILAARAPGPVGRVVVRSGEPLAVRDLAALISRVTGSPIDAHWGGRRDRPREMWTDWHVASDDVGWTPTVPLSEGLSRVWHERREGVLR